MPDLAFVNGRFTPIAEATVSIEDRGMQFGDGVYEVIVAYNGRLFQLESHMQRLRRSAAGIGLEYDFDGNPLEDVLREVRPYVADAWIDRGALDERDGGIGKVGYEINFNREFFQYQPPRPLHEIDAELAQVENRIMNLLREVTE